MNHHEKKKGLICKLKQINFPKLGVLILLTLLMVIIGRYGISTALGNAVSGLTVSPDPIKLGSSAYISYTLSDNAYTSINIFADTGQQVRTVLNSVYKYAGSNFQSWDGRNNSGVLVPDGNYRIVVEAKDSPTGTVIGQAEVTMMAARLPGISLVSDSPDPFNPLLGQQAAINYTLSSNALVTVTILQGFSTVKTITVNEFIYAGAHSVIWDGKDSLGNLAGDAAYTYQIDAVSPTVASFKSTAKSTTTVEKENPQVADFVVNPDPLKLASSNLSILYNISENAKVTLKIVDSAGITKRTILNAVAKNSGYNSSTWDGKDDLANYVPEGTYSVVLNAVDNFNNSSGDQTVLVKAGYQPVISTPAIAPNPFNPNDLVNNKAAVSYNISRDALVTVQILNGYTPVRTIISNQSQLAENQAVLWDGKDDAGNIVGDSPYSYQITAVSPTVSTFSSTFKGSVTVEKGPPSITQLSLSPDPYKLGTTGNLFIGYNLSEPAPVDIKVFQGTTLVRTLVTGLSKPAGYNSASWDGKDSTGNYVGEGICTVVVSAVDNAGNYGEARGNVTAGYLPVISNVTHTPEPFNPSNTTTSINFSLSNPAKSTVTILKGSLPVRTIAAGILTAGSQSVTWDGNDDNLQPVSDGSYTFQIDAESPTVNSFKTFYKGNITVEGKIPVLSEHSVNPTVVKIVYNATFRYTLSEAATVTAQILNAQTREVIRSFPAETKTSGGYYSLLWDTKDNLGFYIVPGNYILKQSAVDSANNTGTSEFSFQAQAVPQITNAIATPATIDLSTGQTNTTISYNINVESYVTLKILDSGNKPFKTIYAFKVVSGSDAVNLNVYENGQAVTGTLTYTIDASSVIGSFRAQQVSGTIQVVGSPQAPPPATGSGCNSCHLNYPAPHRLSNCAGCHSENKPIQDCASCHPTWSHGSEALAKYECGYCHNSTYSYKIPGHGDITTLHTTTIGTDCQKCHQPVLSVEHPLHNDPTGKPYDCNTCHQSTRPEVKQAITNKQKDCGYCHSQTNHEVTHITTALDTKCTTCHINSLTQEHLNNPKTQLRIDPVSGVLIKLTCDTCHNSTDPLVKGAIATDNKQCAACHRQPHNINVVENVPVDIPVFSTVNNAVYWSTPIDASIWEGESWMPNEFVSGGKVLISSRSTSITGDSVWDFYRTQMAANNWVLATTAPVAGSEFFTATFTKETHKVIIWFYGGAAHNASPVLPAGSRIEVIYR
ncbi:MAG: FlgD immunoglobulin-like domain containing protein [Carboxydocellales bacterium]